MDIKNSKVLITKDECACKLIPIYGNDYFSCPNIDHLSERGTVFRQHHTGGPSTIMSNICMFTGHFIHETNINSLSRIMKDKYQGETVFDKVRALNYKCHIIWDSSWDTSFHMREKYGLFDGNITFHTAEIKQGVGAHFIHRGFLKPDKSKTDKALSDIRRMLEDAISDDGRIFLWIHIPHLLNGYTCYGADIDSFDDVIGIVREYFEDDNIYISSDHGDMLGAKGKVGYGYDVYEPVAHIPLITPRLADKKYIDYPTSNVDIYDIIFNSKATKRDFIYCDSQFCAQPIRKLAIIKDNYKYIFNKASKKEELYDLSWDPDENMNLIDDMFYDSDRCVYSPLREIWYYPNWEKAEKMREVMRSERERIWKKGPFVERIINSTYYSINMHGLKKWKRRIK